MGARWNKIFAEDPPQSGHERRYGSVVGAAGGVEEGVPGVCRGLESG